MKREICLRPNYSYSGTFLGGEIGVEYQNEKTKESGRQILEQQVSTKGIAKSECADEEYVSENIKRFREEQAQLKSKSKHIEANYDILYLVFGILLLPTVIGSIFVFALWDQKRLAAKGIDIRRRSDHKRNRQSEQQRHEPSDGGVFSLDPSDIIKYGNCSVFNH